MKAFKKTAAVFCVLSLLFCTSSCADISKKQTEQTRVWTDSAGREVVLPENIEKVALSGPLAQTVLYSLAPEKIAGLALEWSDDALPYIPEEYRSLPVLGQLYGTKGELNPEELLKADPDVVIDIGEAKKTIKEDMDDLQQKTGIPFVHIEMTLTTAGSAFRTLGDLLDMKDRAEEFAVYCENAYGKTQEFMEKIGEGGKTGLLCVTGEQGLNVIAKGSYHGEVIDMIAENLAVVEEPSGKGTGNEVDMEQILFWDPDVVIFMPESIYDTAAETEGWKDITAIRNGKYYEIPSGPYNWMGFPPSIQRYLGMMWLTELLYPEDTGYDLKEEVTRYYRMFYHCDLTDEQYRKLTERSTGKTEDSK